MSLDDICEMVTDGTHASFKDSGKGFPFLTVKDMTENGLDFSGCIHISQEEYDRADAGNSAPKLGDVLFSKDGTVGKVCVVREKREFAVLSSIAILRPKKEIADSSYLGYILGFQKTIDEASKRKTGSAVRRIILKDLKQVEIPLPPLEEQRRIAAILDKADGVRRKRKEAIRLTEELLKSTFLEMFGDPVTNPKGWEICSMKKIVVETQYGTAEKSQEVMGGLPILRMNNITYSGEIDLNSLKWCQIPSKDEDKFTVKRGDLLFNRTNSPELVGKTAVWRSDGKFAYAGYLIRVRFDKSKANSEYVSAFLNSNYGKRYLLEKAKPSINMSNFSASEFLKIPILLPDIETQHRFDEFVSYTRMMSQHLSDGLGDYNNLFNSLLQRAFRGEL
jgi:type I restriction enzyme S subunit